MGLKYIFHDKCTSVFVAVVIGIAIVLFSGLCYEKNVVDETHDIQNRVSYLQGEYEVSLATYFAGIKDGLSRLRAQKIGKLKDVKQVKTMSELPVRVVTSADKRKNKKILDSYDRDTKTQMGIKPSGKHGKDTVFNSVLCGYNDTAMNMLKNCVVEGSIPENGLKEDEVIAYVLRSSKQNDMEVFPCKTGYKVMDYKAGDTVEFKYRKDFNTSCKKWSMMEDADDAYVRKTYKIKAVVYFDCLKTTSLTWYPTFITSDKYIRKICPKSTINRMFVDGKDSLNKKEEQALEWNIIKQLPKKENLITGRSMIAEKDKLDMIKQKQTIYIIAIAITVFLLSFINVINNLRYRMEVRTRDICMYRAIGMSIKMIKKMMLFENCILGFAGIVLASLAWKPVLKVLYSNAILKDYDIPFSLNAGAFFISSIVVVLICGAISIFLSKNWKTDKIMEKLETGK